VVLLLLEDRMIYLMVYQADGKHYASRFFKEGGGDFLLSEGGREIFTITGEDPTALDTEAKKKAREKGITSVINLDN
jgi:hypothetical protein